jgi:hypothetical protein
MIHFLVWAYPAIILSHFDGHFYLLLSKNHLYLSAMQITIQNHTRSSS